MTKQLELIVNHRRRGRFWAAVFPAALAAAWGFAGFQTACVYDPDDRCGPNLVYDSTLGYCVCEPGNVLAGTTCVPCGANEVVGATGCTCAAGYSKQGDAGVCQPIPGGSGVACDNQANRCTDATFNYCVIATGSASGYCTRSGCTSTADCVSGYACDTKVSPAICRRPPVGVGKACNSDADCAGTEATYCDAESHLCRQENCAANGCFEGTECCDLSKHGVSRTICLSPGACQ